MQTDNGAAGAPLALTANIQGNSYHDILPEPPAGTVFIGTIGDLTAKPTGTSEGEQAKAALAGSDGP